MISFFYIYDMHFMGLAWGELCVIQIILLVRIYFTFPEEHVRGLVDLFLPRPPRLDVKPQVREVQVMARCPPQVRFTMYSLNYV